MLPVSLLIWLILEISGYLYFGRHILGVDWPAAIVGAAGGLLGVRAGINAITWVFGMALASPAPRLGFARTARLIFDEYLAFLLTFVLVIPFERLWMPADRLSKGKQPILLVHGYGCSRGVWWLLRRRLVLRKFFAQVAEPANFVNYFVWFIIWSPRAEFSPGI